MLTYQVRKDGGGQFATIGEALDAIPYAMEATLDIGPGVYHEKVFCEKRKLHVRGAGANRTRVVWADGAFDRLGDGKRGTFRSYTSFWDGEALELEDLTIENAAGDGEVCGQALAVSLHARHAYLRNVTLLGHQDTLFMAPLPQQVRQARGFQGPREYTPRERCVHVLENCRVAGTVDFIFGGADALLLNCEIVCRRRTDGGGGFIAAPSTPAGGVGMVFENCVIRGEEGCAPAVYYLARPWRDGARAAFLRCKMDGCVTPAGFDPWSSPQIMESRQFGEYACTGEGARGERAFGARFTDEEAEALHRRGEEMRRKVTAAVAGE